MRSSAFSYTYDTRHTILIIKWTWEANPLSGHEVGRPDFRYTDNLQDVTLCPGAPLGFFDNQLPTGHSQLCRERYFEKIRAVLSYILLVVLFVLYCLLNNGEFPFAINREFIFYNQLTSRNSLQNSNEWGKFPLSVYFCWHQRARCWNRLLYNIIVLCRNPQGTLFLCE